MGKAEKVMEEKSSATKRGGSASGGGKREKASAPRPASVTRDTPVAVSPKDCFRALLTPLRFLKGGGPARAAQLEGLGLKTIEDLLYHLPFRYKTQAATSKNPPGDGGT